MVGSSTYWLSVHLSRARQVINTWVFSNYARGTHAIDVCTAAQSGGGVITPIDKKHHVSPPLLVNRHSIPPFRRIPHWEHHIRFDPRFARKRPSQDVLDRFKRLNNGKSLSLALP